MHTSKKLRTRMQRNNNNGTPAVHPACAACKHQRKKCSEGCILAPYFPAERSREFQAVHKVFGVSNVTKIVKNVDEDDRKKAVDSLVWEACWRQKDPVWGPYGEYRKVSEELTMYKSQNQMMQLPGQGGIGYKVAPGFVGWNGTNGMMNNKGMSIGGVISNTLNYINENGNAIVDSNMYAYPINYEQNPEKVIQEKDAGSDNRVPLQHNVSINGFNQPYYLPGQFN